MKRILFVLTAFIALGLSSVYAIQPEEDDIDLDEQGCVVTTEWIDGMEDALKITISVNGIVKTTVNLDDIVGDQSMVVNTFTAEEGDDVIARLDTDEDGVNDESSSLTVGECPTPVPTSTPVPATAVSTSTPVPATAVPPTAVPPTPIIIIVPAPQVVISPPSTGSGGLR